MKCWHCPHYYIIMWEILWQPVKREVTSHYGMYFGTEICLYTQYSIKIFTFNMFLSSCICMCECVAMCLYTNMGTWEYSFHISDYIRMCIYLCLTCVKVSLFLSLPIQFLFLSFTPSFFQSLRHQTFCYKTCQTVEITLTICTYNFFVVTFSVSLLWCTYTASNIHTHVNTRWHTTQHLHKLASKRTWYIHTSVNRPRGRRERLCRVGFVCCN